VNVSSKKQKKMKLSFKTTDGSTLIGILEDPPEYSSSRGRNPPPVVLFLHGLYQHKNVSFLREFGTKIPRDVGFSTFRFDCRGLGESEGKTVYAPHLNHLRDLESAIVFLEDELKRRVVAILGYSAGGNVALLAASHPRFKHVKNIAMISSRFDMSGIRDTLSKEEKDCLLGRGDEFVFTFSRRGKKQSIRIGYPDLIQFESIDNIKTCACFPHTTRVFLSHGNIDTRVPIRDLDSFALHLGRRSPITKIIIPDANHGYDDKKARQLLYQSWCDWIKMPSETSTQSRL